MASKKHLFAALLCVMAGALFFEACKTDDAVKPENGGVIPKDTGSYKPTPYTLVYPTGNILWPRLKIPVDNPLTVEGIALGKKLFYDKMLSADNSVSCASCHFQEHAFSDTKALSTGVGNLEGKRNAMPLFNLGWNEVFNNSVHRFFWDGRKIDLENQVLGPITDPLEMNQDLAELEQELRNNKEYPGLFKKAFGTDSITMRLVMYAIAQFERTLISSNSKFDKYTRGEVQLSEKEMRGLTIFKTEKGDCFHCHGNDMSPFFTDFKFHNNGLDATPKDAGLGAITGEAADMGLFKTPSLRNLSFTAPYMHDGRFKTLEEVIEFYNSQTKEGATTDEVIRKHFPNGGLNLTEEEKSDLLAFLHTLDDYEFLKDPRYKP